MENRPLASALTVTLDEAALRALDRLETVTGSSRDWLVSRAVESLAADEDLDRAKIIVGMTAAEHGDFASDEELRRIRTKFAPTA